MPSAAGFSDNTFSALSYRQVLQAVESVALTTAPGSWQALNMDAYFGLPLAEVRFKDMLLPFIWVARQQLIARVGAAYQGVPMTARANLERELLATLDALCQQELREAQQGCSQETTGEALEHYNRRGWSAFGWVYPHLAQELAETLVAWVNSVMRLLHGEVEF
ncbi:MAG: hypothetical protein ICV77_16435 [Cyanobacteria bacterium Co-bin8]|nr:hypothetical protein [Cyanobacteria bacterium Co-bin8]